MKEKILDDTLIKTIQPSFINFINSIDKENIGIKDNKFYIRKVKIDVLNESKQLTDFLAKLKLGEYNTKSGYRTYENLKIDKKITKKIKNEAKVEYKHNELAKNKLDIVINDDCLKYMQSLPDNCIDCILTSPPYNFGIDYGNYYSDENTWDSYFDTMDGIIKEIYRILTTGGRVVFNIQPFFSDYIPSHHIYSQIFLRHKFIWRNEILWEKNNYSARYTSWGSWKNPASPYLKYTHEFIEVYCKETIKHNNRRNETPDISDEEFKSSVIGKWSIAPERNMKKYNHDAMFPEKLVEKALKIFTFPNDVVLDPFGGVGTTAVVCKRIKRRYISIDVSKEYCKTAIQRIEDEPNKLL